MNAEQFCYWFQGFLELTKGSQLEQDQIKVIKEHLELVFAKETKERVITANDMLNTKTFLTC